MSSASIRSAAVMAMLLVLAFVAGTAGEAGAFPQPPAKKADPVPPKKEAPAQKQPKAVDLKDGAKIDLKLPKKGETVTYHYVAKSSTEVTFSFTPEKGKTGNFKLGQLFNEGEVIKQVNLDMPTAKGSSRTVEKVVFLRLGDAANTLNLEIKEKAPGLVPVRVAVTNGEKGVTVVVIPDLYEARKIEEEKNKK